jgi:membrane protein
VLTSETVNSIVEPTLNDVFKGGRYEVISIGFVLALWSGSRALNVFVDTITITIMYGLGGPRGVIRTRVLSFSLYVMDGAGHRCGDDSVGSRRAQRGGAADPAAAGLPQLDVLADRRVDVCLLPGHALPRVGAGAYVVAFQHPRRRADHGAVVLLWLYLLSIAVLIGAALNAAFDHG